MEKAKTSPCKEKAISLRGLFISCITLTVLAVICTFFARLHWTLEISTHFLPQYVCILTLGIVFFLVKYEYKKSFALLCVAVFLLFQIIPSQHNVTLTNPTTPIRLVSYNLHSNNKQYGLVADFIQNNNADIVVLLEITSKWVKNLDCLCTIYPYKKIIPRNDNFGIMFLSRIPIVDVEQVNFADVGVPSIIAHVQHEGSRFAVVATHPPPPMGKYAALDRNAILQEIAKYVLTLSVPYIVCGDLNCTPFSPHFSDLLQDGKLYDSRQNFGISFTWPSGIPPLWITIDHCLTSMDIQVNSHSVFSDSLGSDHYPISIEFSLEKKYEIRYD